MSKRYQSCGFNKYKYDPKIAQEKANFNLVNTRRGIDMTEEEFRVLDNIIKEGVDSNDSIYEICIKNKDKINISIPTVYKYIAKGFLQTKRIFLMLEHIRKESIRKSMITINLKLIVLIILTLITYQY